MDSSEFALPADYFPAVAAVSGGSDSTALAVLVHAANPGEPLYLAHYIHRTRDSADHDADVAVVGDLADRLGTALLVGDASEFRSDTGGGPEDSLRRGRYAFLESAARSVGARTILTGHTRDDQVETVLMRLLSGAIGTTLAGIPQERVIDGGVRVYRPLIDATRRDLVRTLRTLGHAWREDRSNLDTRFRRNRVRHAILPILERHYSALSHDLVHLAKATRLLRDQACEEAMLVLAGSKKATNSIAMDSQSFFSLARESRLELLYLVLGELGVLDPSDRPGHRFFAPLLGEIPKKGGYIISGRGIDVTLKSGLLRFRPSLSAGSNVGIFGGHGSDPDALKTL